MVNFPTGKLKQVYHHQSLLAFFLYFEQIILSQALTGFSFFCLFLPYSLSLSLSRFYTFFYPNASRILCHFSHFLCPSYGFYPCMSLNLALLIIHFRWLSLHTHTYLYICTKFCTTLDKTNCKVNNNNNINNNDKRIKENRIEKRKGNFF